MIEIDADESDALASWKLEVQRLRRALHETEKACEDGRRKNCILVEDNKHLRDMLTQIVATAMQGAQA